jgi:hypothetical protein
MQFIVCKNRYSKLHIYWNLWCTGTLFEEEYRYRVRTCINIGTYPYSLLAPVSGTGAPYRVLVPYPHLSNKDKNRFGFIKNFNRPHIEMKGVHKHATNNRFGKPHPIREPFHVANSDLILSAKVWKCMHLGFYLKIGQPK